MLDVKLTPTAQAPPCGMFSAAVDALLHILYHVQQLKCDSIKAGADGKFSNVKFRAMANMTFEES